MTFQSAPDCASVALDFTQGTKSIANVLNFHHRTVPYSQADLDALTAGIDGVVAADYLPLIGHDVTYVQTHARGLTSIVDLESVNATGTGLGSAGVDSAPANTCLCITLRTGHTGRSARGRFYSVGMPNSVINTSQVVNNTYGPDLVSMLFSIQAAAAVANWDLIVLSRFSLGVPRAVAVFNVVTAIVSRNNEIDSQRGRLLQGH